KLKVRQPLRAAHVILADASLRDALEGSHDMMKEELNVLGLHMVPPERADQFVKGQYKPNFRSLGQRGLGKAAQAFKKAWATATPEEVVAIERVLREGKGTVGDVELLREDIEVAFETKPGFAAAGDRAGVVVLETTLDEELRELGFVRELLN